MCFSSLIWCLFHHWSDVCHEDWFIWTLRYVPVSNMASTHSATRRPREPSWGQACKIPEGSAKGTWSQTKMVQQTLLPGPGWARLADKTGHDPREALSLTTVSGFHVREKGWTSQCNPKLRHNISQKQKYICLKTRIKGNSSKAGTQRQSEPRMSQISRRFSDRPC